MRIAIAFEKRDYGGPKPTWRRALPVVNSLGRSKELDRVLRIMPNRQVKKLRLLS